MLKWIAGRARNDDALVMPGLTRHPAMTMPCHAGLDPASISRNGRAGD
jgi:hypothetical protein